MLSCKLDLVSEVALVRSATTEVGEVEEARLLCHLWEAVWARLAHRAR